MVTYTSLTSNKHKLYINTMNQLCTIINYIQNISFHNKYKNQNPHTSKKSNSIHTIGPYSLARVEITSKVFVNQIIFMSICNHDDDDEDDEDDANNDVYDK